MSVDEMFLKFSFLKIYIFFINSCCTEALSLFEFSINQKLVLNESGLC